MGGTAVSTVPGFTTGQMERVDEIIKRFEDTPGRLIPVLHETQKVLGYLPPGIQEYIAGRLNIPASDVYGVVTFYSLFSEKPKGKYCIGVCKGTACYVKNSQKILEKLEEILGIGGGDTTDDGKYSIEVLRCLGACGLGPVITINEKVYTRVKPDKLKQILLEHEEWEANKDASS
ncbi:MAG: NAD(P)H-dependent oxidoreductase subunit E [Firmicutes bacterium]|nr:NAD(P)H-dependent oxidoreductase subunit E [Bacillota bacterium]NSW92545.1 NAD(P)H-dependent oxidoreductase subunit E [Bacillota bacterium]